MSGEPTLGLTPQQKIAVAYAYHCLGQKQQEIAVHYPGINAGRINEACKLIADAVDLQ